ncbi:HipA domain-containing protein [Glutamicibacter sp. X7]
MTEILNAWRDNEPVGRFERNSRGVVTFQYEEMASAAPISLSIPRFGPHTKSAPRNLLDNLLPDNKDVREAWARNLGVPNTPFDLLTQMGEDVAGALSLLPDGREPLADTKPARVVSEDEIADRILSLRQNKDAWLEVEQLGQVRMSLAGAQGKFTLAKVGAHWLWSTAQLPSTHIFKPAQARFEQAHELEAGALTLAKAAGIQAPWAGVMEFLGERSYVTERFDREPLPTGVARRQHIEDLAQSLGLGPESKYRITAAQILDLLRQVADAEQRYVFVRMLAFNTMIGNADAHAKNYSVRLEKEITLTPIYDSLPTRVWPHLESKLAMRIAGAKHPQEVHLDHWRKLARVESLDTDRVIAIVRDVATVIGEQGHDSFAAAGVHSRALERIDVILTDSLRNIL